MAVLHFIRLEPYDGKLSRTVLMGGKTRNSSLLPDYAQIEEMKFPELRDVPMAVGGHEETRHGIILAKNDLAKKYDIKTGESLRDARKKCPDLLIIPPHYDDYMYYTEQVKDIYREYTDQVESFGLDEAWVDFTYSQKLFGDPIKIAHEIQDRVLKEVGLTVSIGVSYNKIFAKLGSDMIKPSGFVVITPENYKEVVWPLPVGDLLYVGSSTERKLHARGIMTIGQLANYSHQLLKNEMGKKGEIIHAFANGWDVSEVALTSFQRHVKSVGNSVTAVHDICNFEELKMVYYVLTESVASRLKDHGLEGNVISISMRDKDLNWFSRQRKVETYTNVTEEIIITVLELSLENYDFSVPLRSIGLSVGNLRPDLGRRQLNLFEDDEQVEKARKVDNTMDAIRNKYGFEAVKRCCILQDKELTGFNPKGDHTIHPVSYF